jgi:hypothetical protein
VAKGVTDVPETVLLALAEVVSRDQHVVPNTASVSAFEHSNNRADEPEQPLEVLAAAAADLLATNDVLSAVGKAATQRGYAGDTRPVCLVYVAVVSRSLRRPVNVAVVSESAAGKNATVDAAVELHPPEAVHEIKAGSARAVIYDDVDYEHRVVLFAEADSIPSDGPAASAVRSLAADNSLAYDVVEQDAETKKYVTRHIVKPGPTGLLTTSTRSQPHQLNTRLLEISLSDGADQTQKVLHAHAARVRPRSDEPPDLAPWHAYGRYLARRASELEGVHIPFADTLADLVPHKSVRMRRDFRQLLSVIEALALMHVTRRTIRAGWLEATIGEDYRRARELLAPLFDTLATEGVTAAVRETVLAVQPVEIDVSQAVLGQRLKLSRSTVSWRVRRALEGGWLVDEAPPRSRTSRLKRGEPLPELTSALPTAERLFECSNAHRDALQDTTVKSAAHVYSHSNGAVPQPSTNGIAATNVVGVEPDLMPGRTEL